MTLLLCNNKESRELVTRFFTLDILFLITDKIRAEALTTNL